MKTILSLVQCGLFSALFAYILMPFLKKAALRFSLVDLPNKRKIHTEPVPLIGGIATITAAFMALVLSPWFKGIANEYLGLLLSATVLFITGVMDDRFDIRAKYKLFIQIACSITLATYGFRITSLYGVFGIFEIPLFLQYLLTIVILTGVVNAFNLMDGVDGLAGGLSILGFVLFMVIGLLTQNIYLTVLSVAFTGGLLVFLKNNFSKNKIFMGDAGSITLGYILVAMGIKAIESPRIISGNGHGLLVILLISYFAVPVLDSLRVYRGRIKRGDSPFRADKTHLHHLLLSAGIKHKSTTIFILAFVTALVIITTGFHYWFTLGITLISIFISYALISSLLGMVNNLKKWKERLKEIEREYS